HHRCRLSGDGHYPSGASACEVGEAADDRSFPGRCHEPSRPVRKPHGLRRLGGRCPRRTTRTPPAALPPPPRIWTSPSSLRESLSAFSWAAGGGLRRASSCARDG